MTVRIGVLHEIAQAFAEFVGSVKATIEVISETIKRIVDHAPRIIKKCLPKVRMPRKPVRCVGCKPDTRGKVRRHPRTKAERRNQ